MEKAAVKKSTKSAKAKISFVGALFELLAEFPERAREIVLGRYGVSDGNAKTLEEIGNKYGITRERVRQVTREVFRKAEEKKDEHFLQEVRNSMRFAIGQRSGIIKLKELIEKLGNGNVSEEGAVRFFLDCAADCVAIDVKGEIVKSCGNPDFDVEQWRVIKDKTKELLAKKGQPVSENELHADFSKDGTLPKLDKKTLFDYLSVSEEISQNNFGKWGLSKWKEITPKGTREKAYLILKEAGKPLHFREIAKGIDKYKLTKKKAHPQTVHNELIKDNKFILVGRGIYALADWGYSKGTVKDVIKRILQEKGQPMTRDAILNEVLKIRQVKKTTIVINLNNFFSRTVDGSYVLKGKK